MLPFLLVPFPLIATACGKTVCVLWEDVRRGYMPHVRRQEWGKEFDRHLQTPSLVSVILQHGDNFQWRRYIRARQVKCLGWKIHHPGSALCFASVIVWTENKIKILLYLTTDRFICFILTVKQSQRHWWPLCFEGDDLKKGRQLFWGKKCIRVTWLEDVLTSKWPGSFAVMAPLLIIFFVVNIMHGRLMQPSSCHCHKQSFVL